MREIDAANRTSFEIEIAGRNFQPHPLAGLRKIAGSQTAGRIGRTGFDLVGSPEGSAFPVLAVVKLQHQFFSRLIGFDEDFGEQHVAGMNLKRHCGGMERVIRQARRGRMRMPLGPFARIGSPFRRSVRVDVFLLRTPIPATFDGVTLRQLILKPSSQRPIVDGQRFDFFSQQLNLADGRIPFDVDRHFDIAANRT